jgi:HEAT repeat protein
MKQELQSSNASGPKRTRFAVAVGIFMVVGLIGLAIVLLQKPPSAAQSQPGGTAGQSSASTPSTAPSIIATTAASNDSQSGSGTGRSAANAAVSAGAGVPSIADLINALKDNSLPLTERKKAIKALAQNGSPEAIAALRDALSGGSDELRAAVAEGLGECASPECTSLLLGLLSDPSEAMVKAAIKGLAQQGSPEAVDALSKLVYDPLRSTDVRVASIDGLGSINQTAAFGALSQAAATLTDDDMVKAVLDALGGRSFDETQVFFQNYLHNPNVSTELRVAATEALSQAQGDPMAFLATLATDQDSEVRAAAAWAMSATEATGTIGPQLLGMVQAESDPDVRIRLYQALINQENVDPASLLMAVQNEKDPAALVTALDLLSKTYRVSPSTELQTYFDQTAVPELKNIALKADTADERMGAVIALVRANDASVIPAMQEIAQQATDPEVASAASKFVNTYAAGNGSSPQGSALTTPPDGK